jgi:hypothetical protein
VRSRKTCVQAVAVNNTVNSVFLVSDPALVIGVLKLQAGSEIGYNRCRMYPSEREPIRGRMRTKSAGRTLFFRTAGGTCDTLSGDAKWR